MTATIFSNIFIFYAEKGLGIFVGKHYIPKEAYYKNAEKC